MTIQEAIEARHSVRAYTGQPLAADVVEVLEEKIRELNEKGHLHMQLIRNETKAFQGKLAKYGKFRGVPGTYVLDAGEVIEAYISIGYGETQGVSHKIKSVEQVSNANDLTPSWFRQGVEAALLAPTAVNQQKFFFEYIPARDGKPVRVLAKRNFSLIGFTQMDLGIAKCHFEIGAGKENFEWA